MRDYKLGNKIYELRKKKNLTQEDLALLLDISDKSVSKWENGSSKPTIENLKKLSNIFEITLDELIEIEEKADNQKKSSKGNHTVAYAMFALIITVALLLILLIIFCCIPFNGIGLHVLSVSCTSIVSRFPMRWRKIC